MTRLSIPQHRLTLCPVPRASRAFSILEGLIVVALLGVLSTIAIQWYANAQHEILERTVNQRNAQEIVSLGVCATVSGADFVVPDNKQATVQNLISGTVGRHGQWKGKTFRLSSLRPDFLPGALTFVKFDSGLLLYDPAGGQL